MAKFSFEKQNRFLQELLKLYNRQDKDFKKSISNEDFVLLFPVIEVKGVAVNLDKPEGLPDSVFQEVEKIFVKIYR